MVLPFGSRSSPAIFNCFAQLLWWVLSHVVGVADLIHYLDDYFFVSPDLEVGSRNFAASLALCRFLGVPLSPDKCLPPSRQLVFLGILLDSDAMVASLPPAKFVALTAPAVLVWSGGLFEA